MDTFIIYALLAGVGVAMITGPLGCFVVWQRMAYFSDSLAHSALLGIAFAVLLGVSVNLGILLISGAFAALLLLLRKSKTLPFDTLLGLLAHSALALGMLALALSNKIVDWHQILFGDLLTIGGRDIALIFACHLAILAVIIFYWQRLLLATINEELSQAEGFNPFVAQIILVFSLTILVTVSFQTVGILLITSLLIIPPSVAHFWTHSPHAMAAVSSLVGIFAVCAGVALSLFADVPTGPAIISTAALLFFGTLLYHTIGSALFDKTSANPLAAPSCTHTPPDS